MKALLVFHFFNDGLEWFLLLFLFNLDLLLAAILQLLQIFLQKDVLKFFHRESLSRSKNLHELDGLEQIKEKKELLNEFLPDDDIRDMLNDLDEEDLKALDDFKKE